jgi:hypothetical protein
MTDWCKEIPRVKYCVGERHRLIYNRVRKKTGEYRKNKFMKRVHSVNISVLSLPV